MAKCYDTIHKGHRPVTLLVAAVCLFPPVFTMRRTTSAPIRYTSAR